MKITKLHLAFIVFICLFILGAVYINRGYYEGGSIITGYFSSVDTEQTYTSDWKDWTMMDAQTMYFHYNFYNTGTAGDDTLLAIIQGGIDIPNDGSVGMLKNLDTVTLTNVGTNSKTVGYVTTTTLTPTAYMPKIRIILKEDATAQNNTNSSQVRWAIYSTVNDYIPEARNPGNH